jgi:hypothetical protein
MGFIEARTTTFYMPSTPQPVSRVHRGVQEVTFSHWSLRIMTGRHGEVLSLVHHRQLRLVLKPFPVQYLSRPRLYVPRPCVLSALGVRPRRMLELFRRFGVVNGIFPFLLHRIIQHEDENFRINRNVGTALSRGASEPRNPNCATV